MEKDFYTDDFEQLLKDTTDDFRMYPSRKVWHSIYNDLHPDRKWPSFAVCLLLITSILYIGIHNNNTINADADNLFLSSLISEDNNGNNLAPFENSTLGKQKSLNDELKHQNFSSNPSNKKDDSFAENFSPIIIYRSPAENLAGINGKTFTKQELTTGTGEPEVIKISPAYIDASIVDPPIQEEKIQNPQATETVVINELKPEQKIQLLQPELSKPIIISPELSANGTPDAINAADKTKTVQVARTRNAEEVMWVEDYAFHNKRNSNKWKTKLSTLVYFTPSMGYRILEKNNNFEPVNALLIRSSATTVDAEDAITQQAALNIESGASVLMDLSKKLKVKGGVQINYTNYISYAEQLYHPTQTSVLLNDLNTGNTLLVPFRTMYGNKPGDNYTRLNNKTIQFSLPIGLDYKLAGDDKFKWYVGATIQPTYVAGGNAYLVSSDYKNYVDMPSMLRTWNFNAGFETFISYKTKNGSHINFGPQFRYQLMSTYSHQYTYSENLYNIGIKVGIMRKL